MTTVMQEAALMFYYVMMHHVHKPVQHILIRPNLFEAFFRNVKGAAETIRENNALGSICARVCPTERYCEKGMYPG